jgi:hypothetical protein
LQTVKVRAKIKATVCHVFNKMLSSLRLRTTPDFGYKGCDAELVAANRASSLAAGLVAFVVVAVGFLVASGLWIAYRVHWEKTRWAAFVEDTATPVRTVTQPAAELASSTHQ